MKTEDLFKQHTRIEKENIKLKAINDSLLNALKEANYYAECLQYIQENNGFGKDEAVKIKIVVDNAKEAIKNATI